MNETFSVTPGGFVESYQPHGFSYVFGIWVDNFSGGWLQINQGGLWVPPYTRGWKATVFPGTTTVTVRSYDFANGARITNATGQNAQVTIWDAPNGDSEGIDFFDQQTIPLVIDNVGVVDSVTTVIIPAPTIGRIRVYEATFSYDYNNVGILIADDIIIRLFGTGFVELGSTALSPAAPVGVITIVPPGGDLPIGSVLQFTSTSMDILDRVAFFNVRATVRYAII